MAQRIAECGTCGETNFCGWHGKDAPKDRHGRVDRDYLDSEPVAYCSEECRDKADQGTTPTRSQPAMYRVAIVREGRPIERRTCASGGELRDTVYELIRSQGGEIADGDHSGLIALVGDARSMADIEGFAALEFGTASITIRPHSA